MKLSRAMVAATLIALGNLQAAAAGEMSPAPKALTETLFGISSLSAGGSHTCAVMSGAGLKCWGSNSCGQLGDSTTATRLLPTDVPSMAGIAAAVAPAGLSTCGLTTSGGAKCWGKNLFGGLGNNDTTDRHVPTDVVGLTSGLKQVVSGGWHACGLTTAGGVKCWGDNTYGAVGDGTTVQRKTPVDVVGLGSGVRSLVAGWEFTCAITANGGVKCWGDNEYGVLGDGTTTHRLTPVDVLGLSGIVALSAGERHACALNTGGAVKCWGQNGNMQLGDGTQVSRMAPVDVTGLGSGVVSLTSGDFHSCVVLSGGGTRCWGYNQYGQLGDGTYEPRSTPVDVSGLAGGVASVTGGQGHSCALMSDGSARCWGVNLFGVLGDGTTNDRSRPVDVALGAAAASVATGFSHSCARVSGGAVKCWGRNDVGQLGDNTTTMRLAPVDVTGLPGGTTSLALGDRHTCVATSSGGAKCWGLNGSGQLGDGTGFPRRTPVDVVGLASGVAAVSAGSNFACALTTAGGIKCWGDNANGQLGDNTTARRLAPVDVTGLQGGYAEVSAGNLHACARSTAGAVKCWGQNASGQLGDTSTANRLVPVDVAGLQSGVLAVSAGYDHTCALLSGGTVKCWGANVAGQLGDGTTTQRLVPATVAGLPASLAVSAGMQATCAVTTSGALKCWGVNTFGQLGDGSEVSFRQAPGDVSGLGSGVGAVAARSQQLCAVMASGGLKCWGNNLYGQVGDGTAYGRATPTTVLTVCNVNAAGDCDEDGIPNSVERTFGTNPLGKDNDIFANATLFAMQQYRDFLGREGDAAGVGYWAGQLQSNAQSRAQMVEAFFKSPEFQATVAPVVRLYFAYFGRIPDYAGLDHWIRQFGSGSSLDAISNSFSSSTEFAATYGSLSNAQFVNLVYQNVLGRPADAAGGGFWTGQLNTNARTRGQVMTGFSESEEYRAATTGKVYVTMMYTALLRRTADAAGFDFWVGRLNGGASGISLIQGLIDAPEYRRRFVP